MRNHACVLSKVGGGVDIGERRKLPVRDANARKAKGGQLSSALAGSHVFLAGRYEEGFLVSASDLVAFFAFSVAGGSLATKSTHSMKAIGAESLERGPSFITRV